MSLCISSNKLSAVVPDMKDGHNVVSFDANLPDEIVLQASGKNMRRDTLVSPDGTIVKDKHLDIRSISIGPLKLDRYEINDFLFNPYIGTNTSISLDLPQDKDLVRWYLRHKESFKSQANPPTDK